MTTRVVIDAGERLVVEVMGRYRDKVRVEVVADAWGGFAVYEVTPSGIPNRHRFGDVDGICERTLVEWNCEEPLDANDPVEPAVGDVSAAGLVDGIVRGYDAAREGGDFERAPLVKATR